MNWTQEQYTQLSEHYRALSDTELLRLAEAPQELTEVAEEVLMKELAQRKLNPDASSLADPGEEEPTDGIGDFDWYSYAQLAPPECTFEFDTSAEADLAAAYLGENRIRYTTLPPSDRKLAAAGPRVVVRPSDAERVAHLFSQPIPPDILERLQQELEITSQDFVPPACPACQAQEAMLISFAPTNHWLCESCEHEWDDPPAPEEPA